MILSMTGFAAVAAELPGCSLTVELAFGQPPLSRSAAAPPRRAARPRGCGARAAHGRAQARQGRLPDQLEPCPPGRYDPGGRTPSASPSCATRPPRSCAMHRTHRRSAVAEILRWPGVLTEPSLAPEALAAAGARARAAGARRARRLARSRGRKAQGDARGALSARIEAQLERVAPRVPGDPRCLRREARRRASRKPGLDPDAERLKQELALFATKIDVAEEVSRLIAHVAEVRRVLGEGGSSGKRLDFLMQELNREANTLGSKSVDAELSQAALELKVLIEQMREQVQNVE